MDLNAAIDIIIKDLHEAGEIIDDLKKYPGVPELQVELAKSKCNSASQLIAILKNIQSKPVPSGEEKHLANEETPLKKISDGPLSFTAPLEAAPKKPDEPKIQEIPVVKPKEHVTTVKKTAETPIIADQFSNRPESYNEKLSSIKHDDDVFEILKSKPLLSLNEAIGINDKFLFIREIFDGDHESYNQAINKLESVSTLSDAMAIVMSFAGEDTSNEAVKQLLDLIKRKFPSNE